MGDDNNEEGDNSRALLRASNSINNQAEQQQQQGVDEIESLQQVKPIFVAAQKAGTAAQGLYRDTVQSRVNQRDQLQQAIAQE